MLENHTDRFSFLAQLAVGKGCHITVINNNMAACRSFKHVNATHEGRFTGTAFADNTEDFSGLNIQVDAS